jgi:hypothetical protein
MEMIARVTVRGAKFFRGPIEGKELDSGKIFVDVELKGETSWGVCTDELKCSGSQLIESIKHNSFPFLAELLIQEMSNGKVTTKIVTGIKPLQSSEKLPVSKAA